MRRPDRWSFCSKSLRDHYAVTSSSLGWFLPYLLFVRSDDRYAVTVFILLFLQRMYHSRLGDTLYSIPSVLVRRIIFRQKTKISAWKCPTRRVCSYSQDCWSVYVQSSERLVYTASTLRIWTPHGVQCRASNPNIRLKLSSYLRLRMIQYKIYIGVMCVCIVYGTYFSCSTNHSRASSEYVFDKILEPS